MPPPCRNRVTHRIAARGRYAGLRSVRKSAARLLRKFAAAADDAGLPELTETQELPAGNTLEWLNLWLCQENAAFGHGLDDHSDTQQNRNSPHPITSEQHDRGNSQDQPAALHAHGVSFRANRHAQGQGLWLLERRRPVQRGRRAFRLSSTCCRAADGMEEFGLSDWAIRLPTTNLNCRSGPAPKSQTRPAPTINRPPTDVPFR